MGNPVTEGYKGARELRQSLDVGRRQRVDPFEVARRLGIIVVRKPLNERKIAGAYLFRAAEERSFILVNATDVLARQRFTAAHELGHWRFDRQESTVVVDDDLEHGSTTEERRANAFAAELLLPEAAVKQWQPERPWGERAEDVALLAGAFGAGYEATLWRLYNAKLLMDTEPLRARYGELPEEYRSQLSARGEETLSLPAEFIALTDAALDKHLISRKRYEELREVGEVRF
jgi:Zn-dependent peptidase ImmA (M78 family)